MASSFAGGFASGFLDSMNAREDREFKRELFGLKVAEERRNIVVGQVLKIRADQDKKAAAVSSMISAGTTVLGDQDVAAALYKTGELPYILEIVAKRTKDGTLDPAFLPSVVSTVREKYGDDVNGLASSIMSSLNTNEDLSTDEGQRVGMLNAIVSGSEEDLTKLMAPSSPAATPIGPGNSGIDTRDAQSIDEGESARIRTAVGESLAPVLSGVITVTPGPDGTKFFIAAPNSGQQGIDAMALIQEATKQYITLTRDNNVDSASALQSLTQGTQYMKNEGLSYTDMLQGMSELSPGSTPVVPSVAPMVTAPTDQLEVIDTMSNQGLPPGGGMPAFDPFENYAKERRESGQDY